MAEPEQQDAHVRAECVQRALSVLCESEAVSADIGERLELAEKIADVLFDYLIGVRGIYDGRIVDAVITAIQRQRAEQVISWGQSNDWTAHRPAMWRESATTSRIGFPALDSQ